MKTDIKNKLATIEKEHQIKILYACEAGSRTYGLSSPDSDFDIRFLYIHPKEWYLSLDKNKDVIELPITESLDMSGWELTKGLRLLRKSNPALLEWLQAEGVYYQNDYFFAKISEIKEQAFNPRACYYHYMHMANRNEQKSQRIKGQKIKVIFHIMRPLLACRWIEQKHTFPPNHFLALVDELVDDEALKKEIANLVKAKNNGSTTYQKEDIKRITSFIQQQLTGIDQAASCISSGLEDERELTLSLDNLFRDVLHANRTN
ncbi:nucleotidyltransferase domain-containing protein [Niallia sp. NCCP-28]|uniref:nucleotidyltransferase domain-containing protein n=1 Tax=Niallia sp. NCCP-28 TaxID=2934712 RepID=UPI00207E7CD0|nr:nucleotidyltransferase domain-containing protein [Niallia sp. NCCP-28]GKU82748.1 hypothetical protein NCCP28_21440 [Niallia sp. NCCP-28]